MGTTEDAEQIRISPPDPSATAVSDADFHDAVAARHRRIDTANWTDIYVVGDVHGCIAELRTLVETLDIDSDDLLVFVGDLVRKGPDSKAVVEFVRRHDNMLSVRGNNEDKLVHDRKTLDSLDGNDIEYLESLPVVISWDDVLVVHGGVDPTRALTEQDVQSVLNCRAIQPGNGYDGPFWFERYRGPPQVFFGHTVLDAPVVTDGAIGLDTGCVYGGALTAYDYSEGSFVGVSAETTYQSRAESKVLEPEALDL
ncbi:MAG: metallophosphoesterase [Haloplanus sp.]